MFHCVQTVTFPRTVAWALHGGSACAAQLSMPGRLAVGPLQQRAPEALTPGIQRGLPLVSVLRRLKGERRGHLTSERATTCLLHLRGRARAGGAALQPHAL